VQEFAREGRERIGRIQNLGPCRVEGHLAGACITVPQASQVRREMLE
jgi:hypothetical protein